ncbi:MAG: hypothetical protein R3C19_20900 [Planctomycetaceae bacterium]
MSDKHYSHHHDQTQLELALRRTKPFFEQYGTALIYSVAAVLAIAAIVVFVQRMQPENADASRELMAAVSPSSSSNTSQPELFRDVADNFPGTEIATWARLRQADRLLDTAISMMFTDRQASIEELDNAQTAYKRLADSGDTDAAIRERVLIGQARLAEARCDGTPESTTAAVEAWKTLLNQFPDGMLKKHAESRIERLGKKETQEFYAWFHKQNPKPGDALRTPADGPGLVPDIPEFPSLLTPSGGISGMEKESTDQPAPAPDTATAPEGTAPEVKTPETGSTEDANPADSPNDESSSPEVTPGDEPADESVPDKEAAVDPPASDEAVQSATETPQDEKAPSNE